MKKSLFLLILLCGCAPYIVHQPDLLSEPKNQEQYSSDLNTCRHQVFSERGIDVGQSAAIGGFGLLGMAAYGKPPAYGQVDDCLRKKGYKIAN